MSETEFAVERLKAWAAVVDRLIAVAPTAAIADETGIVLTGHATPPERQAIRAEARATVARWLARDLEALSRSAEKETA